MNIIDKIEARYSTFDLLLKECINSGYPTYLWGNGLMAECVEREILQSDNDDIIISGRLVNRDYYLNNVCENVFCFEDIIASTNKINLIVAFHQFNNELIETYSRKINILVNCDCVNNYNIEGSFPITYEYILQNTNKLDNVYQHLADQESKDSIVAFINQKISKDYKYLNSIWENNQYFPEFVKLCDNEVFVDCGAYIGDTCDDFVRNAKACNIKYKKIISFEPDPDNYSLLLGKKYAKHECYNIGVSNIKSSVGFSQNDSGSCCSSNDRDCLVNIDLIDNVIHEDVTYIKMDIEGMELSALEGAKNTIKKYRPKIAVCIYHKGSDLWDIYNYLNELDLGYRFYIRAHAKWAFELVLYAIV